MGTTFVHNWLQTQTCDNFEIVFVQSQSARVFASFHNRGWKMDLLTSTLRRLSSNRNYGFIWSNGRPGPGGSVSRGSHDNSIMRCTRYSPHGFSALEYELPPFPQYFPDWAPSDYVFYPNLKKWHDRKRFGYSYDIIDQSHVYFENLDQYYYLGESEIHLT